MGHRFSKTAANNIATATTAGQEQANGRRNHEELTQQEQTNQPPQTFSTTATTATTTSHIPIPIGNNSFVGPTINLQIQESPSTGNSGGGGSATCLHNTTTAIASSSANISTATGILQQSSSSSSSSLTSVNNLSCGRQIIIKIQLAKMENGNEISAHTTTNTTSSSSLSAGTTFKPDISLETLTADCNLNSSELVTAAGGSGRIEGAAQFFNITLNSSSGNGANDMTNATESTSRTAGSSSSSSASSLSNRMTTRNNNYLNPTSIPNTSSTNFHTSSSTADALRERLGRFNPLKFNDEMTEQTIGEIVEYCEVLEEQQQQQQPQSGPSVSVMPSGGSSSNAINATQTPAIVNEEPELESNVCCRRKSKSLAANGGASSSNASSTKRRCRKCSCRDAFRRILDPSSTKSSNKAQKQQQQQLERERQEQKSNRAQERHSIPNIIPTNHIVNPIQMQRNSMHSTTLATNSPTSFVLPTVSPAAATAVTRTVWSTATTTTGGDVIIPLTAPPQFVVVQCAIVNPTPTPAATNTTIIAHQHHNTSPTMVTATSNAVGLLPNSIITLNENPTSSLASVISSSVVNNVPYPLKLSTSSESSSSSSPTTALSPAAGPIVHSQVDFVHYLVPDLERITSSSFYWGKMDRYEAERLLEGKPEGTFLLRDSAQEEFLFSVTFRKYGRSLHARIEQSGHRFSFDCHDPGVYTAPTVTALLEHYKDPACVMFFEPMLTIPLHRKNCFSLQQLCRATIVSNTTYDGINELELPARLKSYLKEYHYKQKLRVKSTEPTYTTHCK